MKVNLLKISSLVAVLNVSCCLAISRYDQDYYWPKKEEEEKKEEEPPAVVLTPALAPLSESPIDVASALLNATASSSSSTSCYLDPMPIVNWINAVAIEDFFTPAFQFLSKHAAYADLIKASMPYYFTVNPYGFYSNHSLKQHSFKLQTTGVAFQGGVTLNETWIVGADVGYWHSVINYHGPFKQTLLNSVSFGPSVAYLFNKAYVEFNATGIYNSYKFKGNMITRWNAEAKLESGIDFAWEDSPNPSFFIQPKIDLNYLYVFKNNKNVSSVAQAKNAGFFRSLLSVQFLKEFKKEQGVFAPSFALGWALMQPLSGSSSCGGDYDNSNQLYLGLKVSGTRKKGSLLSLGAETYLAKRYPIYAGNLKMEISW